MSLKTVAIVALVATSLIQPSFAGTRSHLTSDQAGAHSALIQYGYGKVDVTKLSTIQLAQIRHLAGSSRGTGAIRGQLGAILTRTNRLF